MPHHQARKTLDLTEILNKGMEIGLQRVADDLGITVEEVLERLKRANEREKQNRSDKAE